MECNKVDWFLEQGLGITVFGMAYMFVHDGLVHRRFPVGPIANVPYLRRVAVAHHVTNHHLSIIKLPLIIGSLIVVFFSFLINFHES